MLRQDHKRSAPGLRRAGRVLSVAVMVVGVLFPVATASAASTWVVDDDGAGTAADCSSGTAASTTIQAAINLSAAGDTVFVCPGTYPVTAVPGVTVNKDVTITSAGAAGAIVSGDTKNASTVNGADAMFQVTVDGVTISNLTIDLGDSDTDYDLGVFTANGGGIDNLLIQNSIFRFAAFGNGVGEQLIHLGGGTGNTVQGNNLETASANSVVYLGENVPGGGNTSFTFANNTIAPVSDGNGGGTGINSFGPVVNSTISGNTFTSTGLAVYLGAGALATTNVVVTNNTFTGTTVGPAVLITSEVDAAATSTITVTLNTFTGGAGAAVSVFDSDPAPADVSGATVHVHRNAVNIGNTAGLSVGTGVTGVVDGACNWWGHASGPSGVGPGTGTSVTTDAVYGPWLATSNLSEACSDGSARASVTAGRGPSTDHSVDGATAGTPVETSLYTPTGGAITITAGAAGSQSGYTVFGTQVTIAASAAVSVANPLVATFTIDSSVIPAGTTAANLTVFKDGVVVPACTGGAGTASPNPCVYLAPDGGRGRGDRGAHDDGVGLEVRDAGLQVQRAHPDHRRNRRQ